MQLLIAVTLVAAVTSVLAVIVRIVPTPQDLEPTQPATTPRSFTAMDQVVNRKFVRRTADEGGDS